MSRGKSALLRSVTTQYCSTQPCAVESAAGAAPRLSELASAAAAAVGASLRRRMMDPSPRQRQQLRRLLLVGCLALVSAAGQQDEVDGVFPQVGTGGKALEDPAVAKALEAALKAADKGALARPVSCHTLSPRR